MKVPCRATRKKLQALAELYQCANEEETPGWKRLPQRSPFIVVFILFCMFVVVSLICEEKRTVSPRSVVRARPMGKDHFLAVCRATGLTESVKSFILVPLIRFFEIEVMSPTVRMRS